QADRIKALQDPLSDAVKWADRFLWAAEWVDPAREALKAEPAPGQIERVSLADLEGYGTNNAPRHPDDEAVDRFAAAMKAKLAVKRADGRGGWDDKAQCSQKFLSDLLRGHVDKGDPVDVANFAMMLHQRGEMIAPVPEIETAPITFTYTNWRGETAQRTAVPKRIWFGSTDWHPEPGWLMTAHDLEKAADRDFALADCVFSAPRQSVQDAARQAIECIKADWREFCGYPEDHPTGKMHPVWAFRRLCALAQGAQGDE
ncbi:MAG: hypothetical protein KAI82_03880, partial [Tritonibacter mobilis]|nr:hypothetical protein [Tritonibacter mobilis]